MGLFKVATIGVEENDLASLKSLLSLLTSSKGGWEPIEQPAQAHVTFVAEVVKDQIPAMIEKFGSDAFLVFCLHPGEDLPQGIFSLHRPLRPAELSKILEVAAQREPSEKTPPSKAPSDKKNDDDSEGPSWGAWAS